MKKFKTKEDLAKYFISDHYDERITAIKYLNLTNDQIKTILTTDRDYRVRMAVLEHINITPEHLTLALNDKEPLVINKAKTKILK